MGTLEQILITERAKVREFLCWLESREYYSYDPVVKAAEIGLTGEEPVDRRYQPGHGWVLGK